MESREMIAALRRMAPETGSLLCLGCGHEHHCSTHGCAVLHAAADRLEELTSELPNDPLTLEELEKLVGEPVYIVDFEFPDKSGWEICEEIHTDVWCNCDNVAEYGKTWLAYRRKPEEKHSAKHMAEENNTPSWAEHFACRFDKLE